MMHQKHVLVIKVLFELSTHITLLYSLIEMFQEKECKKVFSHYSFLECPNEIETTARNEQIITVS